MSESPATIELLQHPASRPLSDWHVEQRMHHAMMHRNERYQEQYRVIDVSFHMLHMESVGVACTPYDAHTQPAVQRYNYLGGVAPHEQEQQQQEQPYADAYVR